MITRLAWLAVLLAIAISPAHAQTFSANAATGVHVRLSHYSWFSFNGCRSLGLPQIVNMRSNSGGTVWSVVEELPLGYSQSPQGAHCVGKLITSSAIYYRSRPGFEGVETVEFGVRYPAACTNCRSAELTYQVKVGGAPRPEPERKPEQRPEPDHADTETTAPQRP